jgi:hypothetical protein
MSTNKNQSGQQWIWEGPLDPSGMPMGKGNSINSMKLKLASPAMGACCQPITEVAKRG